MGRAWVVARRVLSLAQFGLVWPQFGPDVIRTAPSVRLTVYSTAQPLANVFKCREVVAAEVAEALEAVGGAGLVQGISRHWA